MDTKDMIFQSALKLFIEKGFSATTISITKEAGLSSGILFHYFPTKTDLIISMYSKINLEYWHVINEKFKDFKAENPARHREIIKEIWLSTVNWGFDNWQKFQFMQLFESSLLANQFKIENNPAIEEISNKMTEITRLSIEYEYLKDVPVDFLLHIDQTLCTATIKYLHNNPQYRYDKKFMDQAWKICWSAVVK